VIIRRTEKNVVEIHDDDQFWTVVSSHYKHIDTYVIIHENRNRGRVEPYIITKEGLIKMFDYDVIELLNDVVPQ